MSDQIRAEILNLGEYGLIFDVLPHQLPDNAFTFGENVIFRRGAVHSAHGREQAFGTLPVAPTFLMPLRVDGNIAWIYTGENKLYTAEWNGSTWIHTERTGATVPTSNNWRGTVLGNIAILNNGVDVPQVWYGSGNFVNLSDWPVGMTAGVLVAFRNFLIAANITESGSPPTEYSRMVWWSDAAEPGEVPPSWEPAASNLAEKFQITSGGEILDIVPLQSMAIVYTESTTWGMQYNGDSFSVSPLFNSLGVLANNCAIDVGGQHVVLTDNDLILHDGRTPTSLIKGRARNWLFNSIDPDTYNQCFLIHNAKHTEVWVCFPSIGQTYVDKALIVDYTSGVTSIRELGGYVAATTGPVTGQDESWDSDTETWNSDLTNWDDVTASASRSSIFMCDVVNSKIFQEDTGYLNDGEEIVAYVERVNLMIPETDNTQYFLLQAIYPYGELVSGGSLQIYVGSRYFLTDSIEWNGPYEFNPTTDYKVDLSVIGRYFTLKFKWEAAGQFSLSRFDFDYIPYGHGWK